MKGNSKYREYIFCVDFILIWHVFFLNKQEVCKNLFKYINMQFFYIVYYKGLRNLWTSSCVNVSNINLWLKILRHTFNDFQTYILTRIYNSYSWINKNLRWMYLFLKNLDYMNIKFMQFSYSYYILQKLTFIFTFWTKETFSKEILNLNKIKIL